MAGLKKEYNAGDLTVVWQPSLCIHSEKCARGLSQVFDPNQRPWINMQGASPEAIMQQVDQCPSGALSYRVANQEQDTNMEEHSGPVEVEVFANGPLAVKVPCEITLADGSKVTKEKASFFCRCGASANKPFCDGTHKKVAFQG